MISMQRIKVGLHCAVFSAAGVDGWESVGDGDDNPGASVLVANNDDLGIGAYGGGGGRLLMHDVNNPLWPGRRHHCLPVGAPTVVVLPVVVLPGSTIISSVCIFGMCKSPYRSMTCITLNYTITCSP
jgi:hypothetical protein